MIILHDHSTHGWATAPPVARFSTLHLHEHTQHQKSTPNLTAATRTELQNPSTVPDDPGRAAASSAQCPASRSQSAWTGSLRRAGQQPQHTTRAHSTRDGEFLSMGVHTTQTILYMKKTWPCPDRIQYGSTTNPMAVHFCV